MSRGKRNSRWPVVKRGLGRALRWLGALFGVFLLSVVVSGWTSFGHRATGARRARMEKSPQWKNGSFDNPEPLVNDALGSITGLFSASHDASPSGPVAHRVVDPKALAIAPANGLRVTWFGHSATLVEIDGARVLTDPMWGERASPLSWLGPKRWFPPPIALADLPPIDAVVISHDHYDHLDYAAIASMKDWKNVFVVPLGVGAHLAYWGIPEERIVELDWWDKTRVGDLEIVATPARHASGRTLFDKDAKLWAGYALIGRAHRVYFSGDTGFFRAMKDIGERLGPFDLTMIETGQYHRAWPDWHIGPEQAVEAHRAVKGRTLLPVHWGLLTLAYHGWTEPGERVMAAAEKGQASLVTPEPGEPIDLGGARPLPHRWWPALPWDTADMHPIISGNLR